MYCICITSSKKDSIIIIFNLKINHIPVFHPSQASQENRQGHVLPEQTNIKALLDILFCEVILEKLHYHEHICMGLNMEVDCFELLAFKKSFLVWFPAMDSELQPELNCVPGFDSFVLICPAWHPMTTPSLDNISNLFSTLCFQN